MLGEKIKSYRESKNMTQNEIADILGVKSATVSKYESGTLEPNIESLKKLAEIFEVSVDELLNDEQDRFDISKINVLNILREQKEMKLKGNLYHNTQIIFAYNTNHIEGSKLTEDQTSYMLDKAEENLTEDMIKEFHRLLKEGTADSRKEWFKVGDYKQVVNEAGSTKTTSPKYVQRDMTKLMDWYNSLSKITIKEIIEFHARFEKIHPFQDGNGRVGRIIIFKECLKNNIIPFIILDKDKLFYYRGLREYQNGGEKGYLIDTCLNAQDQYMKLVEYYLK